MAHRAAAEEVLTTRIAAEAVRPTGKADQVWLAIPEFIAPSEEEIEAQQARARAFVMGN